MQQMTAPEEIKDKQVKDIVLFDKRMIEAGTKVRVRLYAGHYITYLVDVGA